MSIKISFEAINANSSDCAHEEVDEEEERRPTPRHKVPEDDPAIQGDASTARLSNELARVLEIRKYQKTTNLLVARRMVNRLIREILQEV